MFVVQCAAHAVIDLLEVAQNLLLHSRASASALTVEDRATLAAAARQTGMELGLLGELVVGKRILLLFCLLAHPIVMNRHGVGWCWTNLRVLFVVSTIISIVSCEGAIR